MNIKSIILVLSASILIASGCTKQPSPVSDEPSLVTDESLDVSMLVGQEPLSLAGFVEYAASQQYSSLDSIYNRPPDDMSGNYYVQLSKSNEVVNLAEDVTTFVHEGNILAAGFKNGVVRMYGSRGCAAVQAVSEPVNSVSWFPESDFVAVSSGEGRAVEIFNVKQCARVRVHNVNSTVDIFALSPRGSWLALVDKARRLWVGPAAGKLRRIDRFTYKPLSLTFSNEEGILMGVDATGKMVMWSPLKLTRIFDQKIKGGPFKSVKAEGARLNIVTEKDERFQWDVSQRIKSPYYEQKDGFFLKNGVLFYRSPRKSFSKKVSFKPASFAVERSPLGKVYRVRDIDGEFRYYSSLSGVPLKEEYDFADWKKVKLDRNYGFSERGRDFVLAVPIAQREFQRLYCRYIPSKGYYLWWQKVARPDDYFKFRGMLPRRKGIAADSPLEWESLERGKTDIRD
ncbi:WD40 repeat domain-containing protein [Desulfovibrio sp. JC010]|uniref:WD40 repeat domain-containing protein n=1 Tax=Desulfovibrio sp. JC010 TaxID=2593641 RepID=UPI0013CF7812|nr:WD40 repeat domain-containing protein [Desulfovibrio sp. JC010]NDV27140.1 WD40 repeat domain-containing protein [Desulfovibrio sp. JC010]